jgi:hypothetical protein
MEGGRQLMNQVQTEAAPDGHSRFSQRLGGLRTEIERSPAKLRLREVISFFGPKGHAILSLFFVLPFLQPIPIPGLSCVLGFCICFFGTSMFLDKAPWVPERVAKIEVEKKFLLRVTSALESLLKKVEHIVHPRRPELFKKSRLRSFHGFLIAWHAFLLALPLPVPFSNIIPAICIALIALGCLEEDFFVILAGYVMGVVNTAFFIAVAVIPFALHHAWQRT